MDYLLLRGLGRTQEHWGEFAEELSKHGRVFKIDLPGFGDSQDEKVPLSIKKHVLFIREKWKDLNPGEKAVTVIGHSLGGMVALKWLDMFPRDFEAGVIINSSSANGLNHFRRIRPQGVLGLMKVALAKSDYEREVATLDLTSENLRNDIEVISKWIDIREKNAPRVKAVIRQLIAAARFKRPKKLKVPVLFLASKQDQLVSYKNSVTLAKGLKADCRVNPMAGHDLPLDEPKWTLEQILNFQKS